MSSFERRMTPKFSRRTRTTGTNGGENAAKHGDYVAKKVDEINHLMWRFHGMWRIWGVPQVGLVCGKFTVETIGLGVCFAWVATKRPSFRWNSVSIRTNIIWSWVNTKQPKISGWNPNIRAFGSIFRGVHTQIARSTTSSASTASQRESLPFPCLIPLHWWWKLVKIFQQIGDKNLKFLTLVVVFF